MLGAVLTACAGAQGTIAVPDGSTLALAVAKAVLARDAAVGDPVYAWVIFPLAEGGRMAVPPGTYAEFRLESLVKPTRKLQEATLGLRLEHLVYANGYTVNVGMSMPATLTTLRVKVTTANDVLLENGTQYDVALSGPVVLDAGAVAKALPLVNRPAPGAAILATQCHPVQGTSGTPGTPDVVIPGTPSTPGTPDVVIPGINGAPDTVFPGIPASAGTPDTVFPGSPGTDGTPGTYCPAPSVVISSTRGLTTAAVGGKP